VSRAARRQWQNWEIEIIKAIYPHVRTSRIAWAFGVRIGQVYHLAERFGLKKTAEYLSTDCAARFKTGESRFESTQFKPGAAPWNKGMKGLDIGGRNTRFKKGQLNGRAATLVLPVGSLRVNSDGYLDKKISEEPGNQNKRWRAYHRLVWEAENGPVPEGFSVTFKPGRFSTDPDAITIDALELVSRRDLMLRNTVHNLPKELAEVVQLRGALQRQINKRMRATA